MNEVNKAVLFYVEDDKFLSDLLVAKLASSGYRVEHHEDGEKAIAALDESEAELFIIDLLLPKIDGFAVIEKIKATEKHKDKPIVVFSNYGDQEHIDRAFKAGTNKYLVKSSFVPDELVSEIESLLEGVKTPA